MISPGDLSFARHWKFLFLLDSADAGAPLREVLGQLLPSAQIHVEATGSLSVGLPQLLAGLQPHAMFLDAITHPGSALPRLRDILHADPRLAVIVLLASEDPDLILNCLRNGATEFLIRPFQPEQVGPVLLRVSRVAPVRAATTPQGRIQVVMPVKGSCGASTLAVNLAFLERRRGAKRVLLADLDPLTGTIPFQLKIRSAYSFMDALSRAGTLDADVWRGLLSPAGGQNSGIDVLLSPESAMDGVYDLNDASPVLEFARAAYDVIVLDVASPYGAWNLSAARVADELLLVMTNEIPSLHAAKRALPYLEQNRIDRSRIRIVVNRFQKDAGLTADEISAALGHEVFAVLPSDYEAVQRSLLDGKPVQAASGFGKSLASLAASVAGEGAGPSPEPAPPKKKSGGMGGLFDLFSKKK